MRSVGKRFIALEVVSNLYWNPSGYFFSSDLKECQGAFSIDVRNKCANGHTFIIKSEVDHYYAANGTNKIHIGILFHLR